MQTWDDFNIQCSNLLNGQILTDIHCPKCGYRIYFDSTKVLTSYPAQYSYWCSCGWEGYSTRRWFNYGTYMKGEEKDVQLTADVVERKKGHWVTDEDGNLKCPECGRYGVGDNYCEHCGADLREEAPDAEIY